MGVVVAASLIVGVCVLAIVRKKFCVKYGNKSFLMNVGCVSTYVMYALRDGIVLIQFIHPRRDHFM